MELHVLGPSFGLPSIDPDCIAAVAWVKSHCEACGLQWELEACHDTPSGLGLPWLRDGGQTVSGFANIVRYFGNTLEVQQEADYNALLAFIESNAQPLLDISLYVSFENYRLATRAAFTRILPWYANYIIPPRRRAAAKARTEHMGFSSLDMDTVHDDLIDKPRSFEDQGKAQQGFEHETEKRARTLLGRRQTVRSMLRRPEYAGAFRLKALADAFFEPVQAFLGDKHYLLGTHSASALDCYAFGYLSLMLYPQLPQDWLASRLRKQYPKLTAYVERMSRELDVTTTDKAITALFERRNTDSAKAVSSLPWTLSQNPSFVAVASFVGQDVLQRLPRVWPQSWSFEDDHMRGPLVSYLPALFGLASASSAIFGYWAFHNLSWPRGEEVQIFGRRRLTDYGEAGAALAALGGQLRAETRYQDQHQESPIQVDVVVDGEQV